jgi:hypothetical protein
VVPATGKPGGRWVTYARYDLSCETPDGVALTDLTGIQSVRESSPPDCSGSHLSWRSPSGAASRSRSDLCRASLAARPSVGPAQLTVAPTIKATYQGPCETERDLRRGHRAGSTYRKHGGKWVRT